MDENQNKQRRERIKTILLFFLAILLVLTFFSNTIMNYTLPTVSTYNASTMQVSEKIRGSGVITSKQESKIKATGSRKVSSVTVKVGDTVKKGDLLMVLDKGSTDDSVKTAEEALRTAEVEYQKMLLKAAPDYTESNTEIARAREDLQKALDALEEARRKQSSNVSEEENKAAERRSADATAQKTVLNDYLSAIASGSYDDLPSKYGSGIANAAASVTAAQDAYNAAKAEVESLGGVVSAGSGDDSSGSSYTPSYKSDDSSGESANSGSVSAIERNIEDKEIQVRRAREDYELCSDPDEKREKKRTLEDKELELKHLREDLETAKKAEEEARKTAEANARKQQELDTARENLSQAGQQLTSATNSKNEAVSNAKRLLNDDIAALQKEIDAAKEITDAYASQKGNSISTLEQEVTQKQRDLEDKIRKLSETQKKDTDSNKSDALDLETKRLEVEKKRSELEKAKEKSGVLNITAEADGVIKELNVAVGDDVAEGSPLAVIDLTDSGFVVEMNVTPEQAKKVRIGTLAEIRGFYGDTKATLSAIKSDTTGSKNKILVFELSGSNLTPGESVELTVTCSSQSYDLVVPNSSIYSNSKEQFVLVTRSKSTPLGNRYYVTQVNVKVLAKDDQYTAIQGDISGGDAVIKTSEKPLSSGMQVRLEDK